jgi:hypothetical protein
LPTFQKKYIFTIAFLGSFLAGIASSNAAGCRTDSFQWLCAGCSMTLGWKVKRFDKKEVKRWCRFSFGGGTNARKGFTIVDNFSLGEVKTGLDWIRISGLKTGKDRFTVKFHGVANDGSDYASTIHFDVEGDF